MELRAKLGTSVRELVLQSLHRLLRGYSSNLKSAVEAYRNGWLPEQENPLLQELSGYMIERGHPKVDVFLLQFGLTVPGRLRGIRPPLKVLEESRGGLSKRRLSEAEGQVGRILEALEVSRWFFADLDVPALGSLHTIKAIQDEFDQIPECSEPGLYAALDKSEAGQLEEFAVVCVDSDIEEVQRVGCDFLQKLACFRDEALSESVLAKLIERRVFYPSSLYRDAGDNSASGLLELLRAPTDRLSLNHLLLALAWTRSPVAIRAFHQWSLNPPSWASWLHVPPSHYLHHAGLALGPNGARRSLISLDCYHLDLTETGGESTVSCFAAASGNCPDCSGRISLMFDFSGLDRSILKGLELPVLILTCEACTYYGPVFARYSGAEPTILPPGNGFEGPVEDECSVAVSVKALGSKFPPFAAVEPFGIEDASTLGGAPMWIQDSDYPSCPDCKQVMPFVAQLDMSPLGRDGIFYGFYCGDCSVSATTFQQT